MKLENVAAVFFAIIFLLTVVSIDPYRTGYLIMPSPLALEAAVFILLISFFIVLAVLLPKKKYNAY